MRDPNEKERHWFIKIDNVISKEELQKLINEVNDPKNGASIEWKTQILQKAQLKKNVRGWND
jgi:hypothetical protein